MTGRSVLSRRAGRAVTPPPRAGEPLAPSAVLAPQDDVAARVAELSGHNVYACYQCGRCTASCPFSFAPQQVVRRVQFGQIDQALAIETVWSCASCFTCTAACPKDVDPARVMRALRELFPDSHGKRRRAWLFANNHRLSRAGSRLAPVSNWLLRAPGAGLVAQYGLGIHRARSLPTYARHPFPEWFRTRTPLGDGRRGAVLLFHDTFMDYNNPETGIAATELLELAGFAVELTNTVCCGRPMISKGFLNQAREHARVNVERLYERAVEGVFIIGCEASCLLTLRSEYSDLLRGTELEEKAQTVARQTLLLDEFLVSLAERGELELSFAGSGAVLFHAHCHQKAYGTPGASLALLRLAGYDAELVNTACCGMAGAFGYEKEHYQASRAAGERELFPAVRAHPEAQVVVAGVSCSHQIEHFTERRTRHLAQALRDAVAPEDAACAQAARTNEPATPQQVR